MTDTSIYLLPGMRAKIKVPGAYVSQQASRKIKKTNGALEDLPLVQGFAVEYEDVGTIEPVDGEPAVIYTHKKYSQNRIFFFSSNSGEECTVSVISVPIHDHSSIVTGGPAYSTYFTDSET